MDIIITNKHKDALASLNPNNINVLNGFYDVETLTEMVKGFSYDKIILDITSLKNYDSNSVLKKLTSLNPNDIVLFLDDDEKCSSKEFLSKLVDLGIYNFTRNVAGVKHLTKNPNTFDMVKSLSGFSNVKEDIEDNIENNEEKNEVQQLENKPLEENIEGLPRAFEEYKPVFFNGPVDPTEATENVTSILKDYNSEMSTEQSSFREMPFEEPVFEEKNEETESENSDSQLEEQDSVSDSNMYTENIEYGDYALSNSNRKVIGIKNITDHAGATTLIYLMYKDISKRKNCLAIEVDTLDLTTYRERDFVSSTKYDIARDILKYSAADIILVDLNTFEDYTICDDIVYLIEPSLIKMTKLRLKDKEIFDKLKNGKIVLNKSVLSDVDITNFEYETKSKIFFNIPPLNDREENNREIVNFLSKLGI